MRYLKEKKKQGTYCLMLCIAAVCLLVATHIMTDRNAATVYAQEETDWSEVFTYERLGGKKIAITGMKDTSIRVLEIPSEIDGYTVTKLAAEAFRYNDSLTWVGIPDTVTTIERDVFSDCLNLMYIKVPSSVKSIGSGAFYHGSYVAAGVVDAEPDSYAAKVAREQGKPIYSELMDFIMADTGRYGRWDITYKEFIEMYQSIGTDNDLFIKKLSETGTRHTEGELWFDYDGVTGIEVEFEDVVAEKIFALHYAPFDYNGDDLASGNTGKDCMEAYLDHGGVCGILTDIYQHFMCVVLEEYDWQYRAYGNADVNHVVRLVMVEDGRCVQIDNCGVEAWWQGITLQPNYEKIEDYEVDPEVEEDFYVWKKEFETLEKKYWHTFSCWTETGRRPIRYNFDIAEWDTYMGKDVLTQFKCVFRGMEEIISMAGYMNLEGYADIAELGFDMSVIGNRPRKVHVTNGDAQVTIFWDEVEGATSYAVSQYEDGVYTVLDAAITDTEYTVTDLINGEQYTFLVQAFVDGEWSEISERNHIGGLPMEPVPTEDENFYYEQIGRQRVVITGLKNTEAEQLTIPETVGMYEVDRFAATVLYSSDNLKELHVPSNISAIMNYEDYEHLDEISTTVITEDEDVLAFCTNWGIPYLNSGTKPSFMVRKYHGTFGVYWDELYRATGYRVSAWKDGELVTVQEYGEEERSCFISDLEAGTTYQLLVQVKKDGEWCAYTEDDMLSVTTFYDDGILAYDLQEDGTYSIELGNRAWMLTGTYIVPDEYQGKKITKIGMQSLYGGEFTEVILPEGILEISFVAFLSCPNLERVYFPSTLKSIDSDAFDSCPKLKMVYLPDNITYIEKDAFDQDVVIYASADSYPAEFAESYGYSFVEFDGKPKGVEAEASNRSITVSWEEVEFARAYLVTCYDATGEQVWQQEIKDTGCTITSLKNGKEYSITVQSVFGTMKSEVSDEDTVTATPYSVAGVFNFVSRLYTVILNREADAEGLNSWVSQLITGTKTGVDVTRGFILSEEFLEKDLSDEEFIQTLYLAFFNREADEEGLETWLGYLEDGYVKEYIFKRFAGSDEFKDLCDSYGIARGEVSITQAEQTPGLDAQEYDVWQFVERFYVEFLGRPADYDGLKGWADHLLAGTKTGVEVAEGFFISEEFQNKELTNEDYVHTLYRAFFNRPADEGGLDKWTGRLADGYVKKYVFGGLAVSDEFAELCQSYGIERGEVYLTLAEQTGGLLEREFNVWQFVERFYMEVLGRTPDMDGLKSWADKLIDGTESGARVAQGFIFSEEFVEKSPDDEEFIKIMYRAFFGREADTDGLASWLDRMAEGETKPQVFAGFVNSDEFGALCNSYDIVQGSFEVN